MKLVLENGLPFVSVTLQRHGKSLFLSKVLVDSGSTGTVFPFDKLNVLGIEVELEDSIRRISGVGGAEFVFSKRIEKLALETVSVSDFIVEIGAMDYGFELDGILGIDFLLHVGAHLDFQHLEIHTSAL